MDEILERLERIERRLDSLEGRAVRATVPPVVALFEGASTAPWSATGTGFSAEEDLEATLGARWLPRAGAIAVVAAFAYLVGLGLQRGFITPATVALSIAAVCVGFAVVGARLKGPREAFGNVLVGLGAGGLYVDTVGSSLYHEMLRGEATVAICVAVSLATLAFGARRALPSFLGVGLFGGLMAALMPLSKEDVPSSSALLMVVTAPALAVAAFRRWPMAVVGAWGASLLAALGLLYGFEGHRDLRLGVMTAVFMMATAAWAWAAEPLPKADPQGVFPFAAAFATGWALLGAFGGTLGAGCVAAIGGFVAFIGLGLRARAGGRKVALAGLSLSLVIAPLGLGPYAASFVLAVLAIVEAGAFLPLRASRESWSRSVGILSAVQTLLAGSAYAVAALDGKAGPYEAGLVVFLILASIGSALVLGRREARIGAGAAVWALTTRLAILTFGLPTNTAITAAWLATFVAFLAVGFALRWSEIRQLGLAVAAATAMKVVFVDLAGLDAAVKAAVLMGLGLALLGGGYAYVRWASFEPPSGGVGDDRV